MQDNFNIHEWRLNRAINELNEKKLCEECGAGYMEEGQCMECGYMEEGATFTYKHDDNPKLKGGQKKLPDELQAQLVKKEATLGKSNKFSIGDKLQTYGGEEPVTVVGVQPHLAAALKDDKNPLVVNYLKKALRQGLVDREQASQPWYLVKFEGGLPDTDLRYWAEDELMSGELNEGEDYDAIAQEEFGLDYDQLGPNEQEWVRDEAYNRMNEGESNLTPLQQHIYDYEVEISGEDFANEELENIKKLNNIDDVKKYYGSYRGWAVDKDLKYEFYNLIKTLKSKKLAEGEDHEVAMAKSSLQSIMSSASKLMMMLGDEERNIPGWIQDHITNAENYIDQAAQGFHELENNNEEN